MKAILGAICLMALGVVSCDTFSHVDDFTLLATEAPEGIDRSEGVMVTGRSHTFYVGGLIPPIIVTVPVTRPGRATDVIAAVRDALDQAPGMNLLLDGQVSHSWTGVPGVFFGVGIQVKGLAVRYEPSIAPESPELALSPVQRSVQRALVTSR